MSLEKNNLICDCFYTKNYHISYQNQDLHVEFFDKACFIGKNKKIFPIEPKKEEYDFLICELEEEKLRRQRLHTSSQERRDFIKAHYKPLHPHVYHFSEEILADEFLEIVVFCKDARNKMEGRNKQLPESLKKDQRIPGLFTLRMFKSGFCRDLVEELRHFEHSCMPKSRPNSMNHHGVMLRETGFDEGVLNPLREHYLHHIASYCYPHLFTHDGTLDSHKSFTVSYEVEGGDDSLSEHFDNSEVTFNTCLGGLMEGGELYFRLPNQHSIPCPHRTGYSMVHEGCMVHGAGSMEEGWRVNLILWCRVSRLRQERCPMCQSAPRLQKVPDQTGDGFGDEDSDDISHINNDGDDIDDDGNVSVNGGLDTNVNTVHVCHLS